MVECPDDRLVCEGVADAQIRGGIGVALSPLVQRTMAVGRLTLLAVDLSAMFAFEKFQHHVRSRLAARPMGTKKTRGVLEQTRVASPVNVVLVEIEKPD